jgi:hypothetical protein
MSGVEFFPGPLRQLLNGVNGPVARDLAVRAIRVESAAKTALNNAFPPPSRPGEPPHKRTARLQTSVTWVLGEDSIGLYAAVGTNVDYGYWLEVGTDTIQPRPWLNPALRAAA